jgi:(p)ppGpp synthase/HD superfamily hydrolase
LEKHQLVPGTRIPYLMHFSLVAMELIAALAIESSLDGNLSVQCALLHDTLED